MGFRFRRSVSFGPLRWTFSRRGVSRSIGIPGVRVSHGVDGRTRETFSIPGTGLSYQTHPHAAARTATGMRWLGWALFVLFAFGVTVMGALIFEWR